MMPEPPSSPQEQAIPESLKGLLAEYRRKLWRIKITEAFLAGVIGLILSFLIVFALDRFLQTPATLRLILLIAGTSLFAVFAPLWMRRWVWGHRRENELARLIALKHPDLGDRLLGIIELQEQQETQESLSPRLRMAAMETVAADAQKQGLQSALPPTWLKKALGLSLALIALTVTAFLLAPQAGVNALRRWAMPLQETERYTFTKLNYVPRSLVVPHGEAFNLTISLANDSEWKPTTGEVRIGTNPAISSSLTENCYRFTLPAQFAPCTLALTIGDARHSIHIEPTSRPAIQLAEAILQYPGYLQLSDETIDLKTGVATAVQGSQLRFQLSADRALEKAALGPITHITQPEKPQPSTPTPGFRDEMKVDKNVAVSNPIAVDTHSFDVPFAWTDVYQLSGDNNFRLRVEAIVDNAPSTYIQGVERQHVMLPEETIDFDAFAEDDFGLIELGLEWKGEAGATGSASALAEGSLKLQPGSPSAKRLGKTTAFCPAAMKIGPQKLLLRAYTRDYMPDRPKVYSEPITLFILTRDEHAQMLKNQFDRIVGELEDATRREQNANEENQRLERLNPEDLQKEENRKRLEAQQKAEQENMQRVGELEKRMEQLLKDSARNGEIDKDTMKKMSETMKSLGELSQQDMPKVEGKLGESQQQNNTPEQSKKDVQKAVEEQKKVLEKMQQTLEKAREANKNMEASTFVNRLKKAASEEDAIAATLIEYWQKSLGVSAATVDPSVLTMLAEMDRKQANNAADIRWIQEDLGHFFTRTNKEVYKEILEGMRDTSAGANIDTSLEQLRDLLKNNKTSLATNSANYWSGKLKEWAKKLEGEKDDAGGQGGGGGGQGNPEDEDFEFMLRVMKMIQQQQDLRATTRALEELKRSAQLKP
jgi:hypothetical protein